MNSKEILTNIKAGLISGSFAILLVISFTSFVFTGHLAPYLSFGVGISILSTLILRLVIAKYSSIPGVVSGPFMVVYLFIALMGTAISNHLVHKGLIDQIFPTEIALIILSTFSITISMTLLGYFRLGSWVRFIPYPVIGGFLAGVGLSIIFRGVSIIIGKPFTLNRLPEVFRGDIWPQILVSLLIALMMLKMMKGQLHLFIKMALFLGLAVFFWAAYKWINSPTPHYWFIGPVPSNRLWPPPLHFSDLFLVNWSELRGQMIQFGIMIYISILAFLVNVNGIEIFLKQDFDIDRELKITGFANFITMLFGGIGGIVISSQTVPHIQQGGTRFLSAITASILALCVLLIDASYLSYIPKSILAGACIFLGIIFLIEWAYKPKFRLPRIDYILLLVILGVNCFFGFLYGTIVGIIFAAAIFIYTYSQTNVVKYVLDGNSYQSNVERSLFEQEILKKQEKHIYVMKLQGFLFFGTAYHLLKIIKKRLTDDQQVPVHYLVLDLALVNNLDSSAALSFSRLFELAKTLHFVTLFCNTNDLVLKQLTIAGYSKEEEDKNYHFFPNLDFAMEWCENQILAAYSITVFEQTTPAGLSEILPFFERVEYQKGETVIQQGEYLDELYYILSGKITVLLEKPDGQKMRLKTLNAGTFIGELSFFSEATRSTSVVAEMPTTLSRITKEKLKEIENNNPQIVFSFYKVIARILSERVANQNKTVELLTHEEFEV